LFSGKFETEGFSLEESVLIDYNGMLSSLKNDAKHYIDMSPRGNYIEAINNIYDVLRWAETKSDAKTVLITHMLLLDVNYEDQEGAEHRDALFDRVFRATSGRLA
jgi:hypothetical protein